MQNTGLHFWEMQHHKITFGKVGRKDTDSKTLFISLSSATQYKTFFGLSHFQGCWCLYLFLGTPMFVLPVWMYSRTNLGVFVLFILNTYCVLWYLPSTNLSYFFVLWSYNVYTVTDLKTCTIALIILNNFKMFPYYLLQMCMDLLYTHYTETSVARCIHHLSTYGYLVMQSVHRLYMQHNQIVSRLNLLHHNNTYLLTNVVPSKYSESDNCIIIKGICKVNCSKLHKCILQFFLN
jgi:hypothetical protein